MPLERRDELKLSEIKGERTFDVIAEIIGPVATIAQDEDVAKLFDGSGKPEKMTSWQYFIERIKTAVPVMMRKYRGEICEIMATLNDITTDEYVNGVVNPDYDEEKAGEEGYDVPKYKVPPLSVPKLFADVMELMSDSEFVSFFS